MTYAIVLLVLESPPDVDVPEATDFEVIKDGITTYEEARDIVDRVRQQEA